MPVHGAVPGDRDRKGRTVLDPRDLDPEALMAQALRLGANGLAVRRLGSALLGRGIHDPKAWGSAFQVPRLLSDAIGTLPRLAPDGEVTSPVDGFQKLRFRTHDGLAVETVLIPLHKRGTVSVCLSSQVGCAMGCVFCATARMTARRNLAAWEILDQWIQGATWPARKGGGSPGSCSWGWASRS